MPEPENSPVSAASAYLKGTPTLSRYLHLKEQFLRALVAAGQPERARRANRVVGRHVDGGTRRVFEEVDWVAETGSGNQGCSRPRMNCLGSAYLFMIVGEISSKALGTGECFVGRGVADQDTNQNTVRTFPKPPSWGLTLRNKHSSLAGAQSLVPGKYVASA